MKNIPARKTLLQSATCALVSALILFVVPVYSSLTHNDSNQGFNSYSIKAGDDKRYSFSDIKVACQGNFIFVSGRVKSAEKQLSGHIDIVVIDSTGKLKRKVSVKPYFNNRPGISTKYMIGFPFRATILLDRDVVAAHHHAIRLALHRDSERRDTVYDCGANKAVQEYGSFKYEIQIPGR